MTRVLKQHPLRTCDASASVLADGSVEFRAAYLPRMNRGQGFSRWAYHLERNEIGLLLHRCLPRLAPGWGPYPWERAEILCVRRSSAISDRANLAQSFKPWLDALQPPRGKAPSIGLISSDKPTCLLSETYEWEKAPPKQGGILIRVTEVASRADFGVGSSKD